MVLENSESGRSLVEIIGVLAIMGIITVAAFILIRSSMATQKRSAVADDVTEIVTGVRTLYADYDEFPDDFDGARTLSALSISENGPYTGSVYEVSMINGTQFEVALVKMPERDCMVLATKTWTGSVEDAVCKDDRLIIQYNK